MTSTDIDENLREQSKLLLRKLKEKQGRLQNIVQTSEAEQPTSETFVKQKDSDNEKDAPSSLTNVKEKLDTSLKKSGRQPSKSVRSRFVFIFFLKIYMYLFHLLLIQHDNKSLPSETFYLGAVKTWII